MNKDATELIVGLLVVNLVLNLIGLVGMVIEVIS
jgi:preprotein translocase subunit Sss1